MPVATLSDRALLERFTQRRDDAAFEQLVKRHGPLVWGVCRRVLRDQHAAEDAFQATFLVLVRKARSIRKPELLGNWLYGVASRVSIKARTKAASRQRWEKGAMVPPHEEVYTSLERQELQAVLDEELRQLPHLYQAPLVLCYLQGKTNVEAAQHLGWPEGSMSGRLAQAREKLRSRLARRGYLLSATLFATVLSQNTAQADVPAELVRSTLQHASLMVAGKTASGVIPASIAELVHEALHQMLIDKLKLVGAVALLLVAVGALVLQISDVRPASPSASKETGSYRLVDPHTAAFGATGSLSPTSDPALTQAGNALQCSQSSP